MERMDTERKSRRETRPPVMEGMVAVGKIGKLFGTNGELMISLYDDFPRDFNTEEPVYVNVDSLAVPLFFSSFERRGRSGAVVAFGDIDNDERASSLIGSEFFIVRTDENDEDEGLYMEDFVGWEALFDTGERGRITGFIESELNPLFEVTLGGAAELIPASDDFIAEFDETRRRVMFSLPEGLLDINK